MASIFKPIARPCAVVVFSLTALMLCLSVHAQNKDKEKETASKLKYGVNKPLGDTYVAVRSVADEQARLVLYRAPIDARKAADRVGVVSVFLNDRYHASLQKESYSVICMTGLAVDVRTRFLADHTAEINPELDARHRVTIKAGQSTFLRVADQPNGKSRIDVVSPQVAGNDLAEAKQQMHTLSRVPGVQICREADATRMVLDQKVITFGTDVSFDPKTTEIHTMSAQARQELIQIIQKVNVKYKTFDNVKVHVVGFADDEPSEALNRSIAQERAKSVIAFFKAEGLRVAAVTFEGRASEESQKTQHFGRSSRRVEVEVSVGIN